MLFATISRRRNCCSGFQPVHLSRGAHLKAPFCHAAKPSHRPRKGRDVAQAPARKPAEAEIVVLVHQRVPQRTLLRRRQADLDLGQGEAFGCVPMNRAGAHALVNRHAGIVALSGRERQRKVPTLPKRVRGCHARTHPVKRNQTESSVGKPSASGHPALTLGRRPAIFFLGFTWILILPSGVEVPFAQVLGVGPGCATRGMWPRGQSENSDVHIPFSLAILA